MGLNDYFINLNNVGIYPNPSETILNVRSATQEVRKCVLSDLLGKEIIVTSDSEINISNIEHGTYILKVYFKDNNSSQNFKVFKN
ncbi:MAG: hypothetical protein JWO32_735 [Bacteroidetes bacterium]|nr:hypothetical protein [Bacteroidota bacterium]